MKINDRFPVTEELLREVVSEGLKHGGDWCDLYFEDSSYNELLLRDGEGSHFLGRENGGDAVFARAVTRE